MPQVTGAMLACQPLRDFTSKRTGNAPYTGAATKVTVASSNAAGSLVLVARMVNIELPGITLGAEYRPLASIVP